ncbi:aminopeptidase [Mycoplasmatota bacterium]|nr:aminopeptidase [Mycoplasmatota bacterium]
MKLRNHLKKYANLLLRKGVNLQEGQELLLSAPIDAKDLVEEIVTIAYKDIKSGRVHINWNYGKLTRISFDYANEDVLLNIPEYSIMKYREVLDNGAAMLSIIASDPKLLAGVDPSLLAKVSKENAIKMKPISTEVMSGKVRWSLGAMPSEAWAKTVFPNVEPEEAVEKLWEYIFACTRVDQDDPIKAWNEHEDHLNNKKQFLNEKKFVKLHYKAPGTDLTVELPKNHIWVAGPKIATDDKSFIPNIPTEEVFTLNKRNGVNGTLSSTMPLNLNGNLIEDFSFVFENGKVVDFDAKVGKESLAKLLEMDEGVKYLGEVALVPVDSPISNLNTIFYNTLYDENASCHFALGKAYPYTLKDGTEMSEDQLLEAGANISLTHVDFMVGSKELSIDAYDSEGNVTPIFRNGNWA